ncbi:arylsulfatase [Klebsiella pneumoniae]|uniref:arylsulfatase n=1 Tax=Klebsiella pneumoniae TaxID=573 RepID=UPI001C822521|nr:arylsulfatase [Klebsiella pneumoniae]MBX4769123.1 arylsulfatase [Klebsiella pneumoniae]MEA4200692.1 arylsulfatase [Klebsiella pneumoniae]
MRNIITSLGDNKFSAVDKYSENSVPLQKPHKISRAVALAVGVTSLLLSSFSAAGAVKATAPEQQPNIVMIVLDDVGFADLGAFGSEIKTPNIDLLAYSGLRYNRFDTSAISAPTRASLITGRNSQTVNMEELPPKNSKAPPASVPLGSGPATSGEIPLNAQNVAQALQGAGYATYALGKWHLAPEYKDDEKRNQAFWPKQRGFDHFYGFLSGHTSQYHPELVQDNTHLPRPDQPGYHLSEDLVERAMTALDSKENKPKFVYLAFGAAHSPLHVPQKYIDGYKGRYDQGWDKLRLERFERQKSLGIIPADTTLPSREFGDDAWDSLTAQQKRVYARFMETYAGYLTHTDEQIGRLVNHLKETGQFDNTLIVLMSDNGAAPEGGKNGGFRTAYMDKTTLQEMDDNLDEAGGPKTDMLYQRPWAYAGNTPFRRYKLWPLQGGVRTPLIVSWPKVIEEKGVIRHQYVSTVDIAPTLLAAAGTHFADTIDGVKQLPVAGQSFLPTLTSDTAKTRDVQYFELRGQRAITQGKWRAVALHKLGTDYSEDIWMLFDTEKDFSESTDLARKNPEKLEELKKLWWAEANRHSNPPVIDPVGFLYKFNRMDNAFGVEP